MVDWATQNRLYPPGYRPVEIRLRRGTIDTSLPFAVASTRRHNCRLRVKNVQNNELLFNHLRQGLERSTDFHQTISVDEPEERKPKLIATYTSKIHWPRSICCLTESDGSLVICEQEKSLLLLFTSQMMLRSTCGGQRGTGLYEFDSPWSVASLMEKDSSLILVADSNNRRVQLFSIDYHGDFRHRQTFETKEKPFFLGTSYEHFVVSCERGLILCYLSKTRNLLTTIDLTKTSWFSNTNSQQTYPICMDPETSFLFISDTNVIVQSTINGEYLRTMKIDHHPFVRISSLIFDSTDQQLLIVDSLNSLICSFDHDLDDENFDILLKHSDQICFPQSICLSNEGHLVVAECSVTTEHALKIFRHHPCHCHSRTSSSSVKTSETTSVRSVFFPY